MTPDETTQYRAYPIRWLQLLVFFLACFANGIPSLTFAPIKSQTAAFFGITITQVDVLSIVFFFLYVVGTILSIKLSNILSMRMTLIIGNILNMGVFIRLFALISPLHGYPALVIGQILPAIATPFFMNIIALFAARWFPLKQRDIVAAIGTMANPLGTAIGSIIPPFIVTNSTSSKSFFILLMIEAGFIALATLLIIIIFRSEPPTPPSLSEKYHVPINIKRDLRSLFTNRHFLILLFSLTPILALFNAISVSLSQLIEPTGYSSNDAGIFSGIILIPGLVTMIVVGVIMDRTHAYRSIIKVLIVCSCASGIYFILILQPNKFYPLAVSFGLMSSFMLPLLPVTMECAVECTYPICAEWSSGLLFCIGNILSGIFVFIFEALIKLPPVSTSPLIITPCSIFILCCFVISTFLLLSYKGAYKRLEAEKIPPIISLVDI